MTYVGTNKRELVQRALAHQENSRVPYVIDLTTEAIEKYGDRLLQDYAEAQVQEDLRLRRLTKTEAISLTLGNHMLHLRTPWWQWYGLTDRFLKEEETPDTLPDTIGTYSYDAFFEHVQYIREHYDVYLLGTIWGSHWEKAYFARGIQNFLCDLAADPEWSQQLLDMIIRKNMVMLENFLPAADLDGVLLGSDWGSQRDLLMSPTCFRTMILPGEKQEYDLIHRYGKKVFVHSCGCITRILPDLVEAGVDCLNPVQPECMDISALKRDFGDKLTFYGAISTQQTLPYGTVQDVIRETERVIELMNKQGGYITAPSQGIQADVPYENLRALIDTARAHA